MRNRTFAIIVSFVLGMSGAGQQKTPSAPAIKPIETTVCKILENPSAYNNELVEVRGFVVVNFEYSVLMSESCLDSDGIWFVLADHSPIPGQAVTIHGKTAAGGKDSKGQWRSPIPVILKRDASFEKFESYLTVPKAQPGKPCGPDCHEYRVTATFIGRLDAVSKEIRAAHIKRSPNARADSKGFGQMGLFDAELVVQSVAGVEVEDLAHPGEKLSQPK